MDNIIKQFEVLKDTAWIKEKDFSKYLFEGAVASGISENDRDPEILMVFDNKEKAIAYLEENYKYSKIESYPDNHGCRVTEFYVEENSYIIDDDGEEDFYDTSGILAVSTLAISVVSGKPELLGVFNNYDDAENFKYVCNLEVLKQDEYEEDELSSLYYGRLL